jgi:alpha-glucosidase
MNLMQESPHPDHSSVDNDWWRGAVIYQIYPRSYQDSNADGIGDIAGIIGRLPYIASLGVDAIWVSPFFRSPMLDFGYDVSDYRDIDPMFGTLADFDALIERAHEFGIKVLIDLVLSHSSDQHNWFLESMDSRDNPKADWYVWADAKPDGSPPNNWLSIFGGPAWEWSGTRMQYYLHNFLKEQPDLNFHNPDVQEALLEVARFWLERGVDGFRLDTINFYVHDAELRDNPPLDTGDRNATIAPSVNPYNWQDHLYDKSRPENFAFLRKLRALMDEYPAVTAVGEVGDAQRGLEIQVAYTAGDDLMHMCYAFEFLSGAIDAERVVEILTEYESAAGDSWPCWAFSNHDVVRHATRMGLDEEGVKAYAALMLSLRGTICLYQGEELGLHEAYVPFEDLQDPYGIRFWPKFKGRDGCRTPMPWLSDNHNAGFSEAKPWLPVAPEHLGQAVNTQDHRDDSPLRFYRAMIAYRHARPVLVKGAVSGIKAENGCVLFERSLGGKRLLCAINLTDLQREIACPEGAWQVDTMAPTKGGTLDAAKITLPAFGALFATIDAAD